MKISQTLSNNAHWLLRIALASIFLYHGFMKFSNLQGFSDMLPISYTQTVLVALAEVGGGLLVLLGGFGRSALADIMTRVGALLNVPVMLGAIAMVHWGQWNFLPSDTHPMGGMAFQTVLLLMMLYLVAVGNQRFESIE